MLVNNALARDGHVRDPETDVTAAAENVRTVAAGDFIGLFELCNAFIPAMQEAGGGSIVNVASICTPARVCCLAIVPCLQVRACSAHACCGRVVQTG